MEHIVNNKVITCGLCFVCEYKQKCNYCNNCFWCGQPCNESCSTCNICLLSCDDEQKQKIHDLTKCLLAASDKYTFIELLNKGFDDFKFVNESSLGFFEFLNLLIYNKYTSGTKFWKIWIVVTGYTHERELVFNEGKLMKFYKDHLNSALDLCGNNYYQKKSKRFRELLMDRFEKKLLKVKGYAHLFEKYNFDNKNYDNINEFLEKNNNCNYYFSSGKIDVKKIIIPKLDPIHKQIDEFVKSNPDLNIIRGIITDYRYWKANKKLYDPDFYYSRNWKGDWGIDDSYTDTCETWKDAKKQMGTTNKKFSLYEYNLPNDKLQLIADFLNNHFRVIICTYNLWRLGYDYELFKFRDYDWIKKKPSTCDYFHLCLS